MDNKNYFPFEKIVGFKGNRYELVNACVNRARSIMIKKKKEKDSIREEEEPVKSFGIEDASFKKVQIEREDKISGLAMNDVLSGKVKYYNARKKEEE